MSGEAKTLKQVQAAQSIIQDVLRLLDTFYPYGNRDAEARFVHAMMSISRKRLEEVKAELSQASYRASISPEKTTLVSKDVFEDVRKFRAIGPARLWALLNSRRLLRDIQRRAAMTEEGGADAAEAAPGNVAAVP